MIAHQTIGMHLPTGLHADLAQRGQETLVVGVIPEDWLTAVAAIHHVIKGSRILDSQFARHARDHLSLGHIVNTIDRPLFPFSNDPFFQYY